MRQATLLGIAAALLTTVSLSAQAPATGATSSPRWGAEASIGELAGAHLLRFTSARTAVLIGFEADIARRTEERLVGPDTHEEQHYTLGGVTGRLGLRRYGPATVGLRPLVGAGLSGSYRSSGPVADSWAIAPYAEAGAAWFFTPHISLGAAGQLSAGYRGLASSVEIREWYVRFGPMRLLGAVYF